MLELLKEITGAISVPCFVPFPLQMPANFGADTIKAKSPSGDVFRTIGFFTSMNQPTEDRLTGVRQPLRFIDAPTHPDTPAPTLGSHGRGVLHQYGMDDATIDALIDSGALRLPEEDARTA